MECIAPDNTDKKDAEAFEKNKKSLREKLELIENPIVLAGETYKSPMIDVPNRVHYLSILMSEEIAANCITSTPITMERVAPEKLISHYEPRIDGFKEYIWLVRESSRSHHSNRADCLCECRVHQDY